MNKAWGSMAAQPSSQLRVAHVAAADGQLISCAHTNHLMITLLPILTCTTQMLVHALGHLAPPPHLWLEHVVAVEVTTARVVQQAVAAEASCC